MPGRSDVVRSQAEGAVLELFNTRMAAVSLGGYIFFGSSVSISEKVRGTITLTQLKVSQGVGEDALDAWLGCKLPSCMVPTAVNWVTRQATNCLLHMLCSLRWRSQCVA